MQGSGKKVVQIQHPGKRERKKKMSRANSYNKRTEVLDDCRELETIMYNNMYRVFCRKVSDGRGVEIGKGRGTVSGRKAGQGAGRSGTKGNCCCPIFSLRCRDTWLDRGILKREGQEVEGGADGFLMLALGDGGSNAVVDGDGGDGGDGPGKKDNRNRRT